MRPAWTWFAPNCRNSWTGAIASWPTTPSSRWGFLKASGINLDGLYVLDTRDVALICQPSLRSTGLARVAEAMKIDGGGHRAYADALLTARMLHRFCSAQYLGGLPDKFLAALLHHTHPDWPLRRTLLAELARDRNLDPNEYPDPITADDVAEVGIVYGPPEDGDPVAESRDAVREALAEGGVQALALPATAGHVTGFAEGIVQRADGERERTLVAVPSLHDFAASHMTDNPDAVRILDHDRYVDLKRLQAWMRGRQCDDVERPRDYGESRFLAKVLAWLTHAADPVRQDLVWPVQHGMPTLPLDQTRHWSEIRGRPDSDDVDMAPWRPHYRHVPDTAHTVVVDHRHLLRLVRDNDRDLERFDSLIVDDGVALAGRETRAGVSHALLEIETGLSTLGRMLDRPSAGLWPEVAGLFGNHAEARAARQYLHRELRGAERTLVDLGHALADAQPRWRRRSGQNPRFAMQATARSCAHSPEVWAESLREMGLAVQALGGIRSHLTDLHHKARGAHRTDLTDRLGCLVRFLHGPMETLNRMAGDSSRVWLECPGRMISGPMIPCWTPRSRAGGCCPIGKCWRTAWTPCWWHCAPARRWPTTAFCRNGWACRRRWPCGT